MQRQTLPGLGGIYLLGNEAFALHDDFMKRMCPFRHTYGGVVQKSSVETGSLAIRLANMKDVERVAALQQQSITHLQKAYLTPDQIEASRLSMGLDTQLIEDQTYFCVIAADDLIVGCGGWSFRATLYGNNDSADRSARRLDPATERARIRAMYTHPDHTKKGIGRMILEASETAAREAGFKALEMAATEAGRPFYLRCGYEVENAFFNEKGAVPVPLYTMVKTF